MVGKVGKSQHVRRPVPAPPPPRRSDPPPPYSRYSTLTSAASKTRTQWLSAYHPKKLWKGFFGWITAMYRDFLALFKKKRISVEKVEVLPRLKVGQQNYFTFEECEHLVYLVTYNEDQDLELLGLRYLEKGEGGVVVIKQMEELSAPQQLLARRERAWIECEGEEGISPFKKMLQELLKWARRQIKDVYMFRNIDASDVYFIADYATKNFRIRHDAKVLESFITELDALKRRLKTLLWNGGKGHKKSFLLHIFSKQERADLARFRRMLSFLMIENEPVDGAALKVTQLHDYWRFWDKVEFLPQHQLAIDLDDGELPDPELYRGMRVSIIIS